MKRAVNSISHNVAEGFGSFEAKDKTRFYKISRGSAYELISQIITSARLKYISSNKETKIKDQLFEIIGELNSKIKTLETK